MPTAQIYFRERPRDPLELWANRQGSSAEIERSARMLLDDLREEGFRQAAVFIGKKRVRRRA